MQNLSAHLAKRLREPKENLVATEAKKDLASHAKFLHKNLDHLQALHNHNPEIAKEMQWFIERQQSRSFER